MDEEVDANNIISIPNEDLLLSHPALEEINGITFREYSQNSALEILHNIGIQLQASPQLYE